MSNIHELKEVGIIVGEASSSEFLFASSAQEYPSKWEYLLVRSKEEVDGKIMEVPVLAQVQRIISSSQVLSTSVDLDALKRIAAELQDVRTWGRARVLGYLSEADSRILQPRRAVTPGKPIYTAPKKLLEKFYSFPEDKGLVIGHLITRSDVEEHVSVEGFRRHLAIIAQTGAGKSYCAGVLVEELLRKGATIIIIDPHADYVLLGLTSRDSLHEFSGRITIFRNPASTGRYGGKNVGNIRPYEIAFTDLDPDEVCDIARIPENARNIREAIRQALRNLKGKRYTPEDLVAELENPTWATNVEGKPDRTLIDACSSAVKYIRSLSKLRIFTLSSTHVSELLKSMNVSVVDLSGLEDKAMNYIAARVLYDVYEAVSSEDYKFPVFVFIEEAHKFVPPQDGKITYAAPIINKIAAEGRKFGVFLTLITQRPSKVDSDSLSQCNSQIIMKLTNPEDQAAVQRSSERLSADLLADLPGLNPGECVIVGEIAKAPLMIKVRPRVTKEGGADVDIVKKLAEARRMVQSDELTQQERARRKSFTGELV